MSNETKDGGKPAEKPVMDYKEPEGPKYQHNEGPGLRGGINHGNCGTQGRH